MEQLNQYARKQEHYGQEIKRLRSNMAKDSQERKTPEYIHRRSETLQDLWQQIEDAHAKMEAINKPNHEYFTSGYYEQLSRTYRDALQYLKDCPKAAIPTKQHTQDDSDAMEDPDQVQRIKRQEVRIKRVSELLARAKEALTKDDSRKTRDYLKKLLQDQMENVRILEEDIQVNEINFQSMYFTQNKYNICETEFEKVIEQLEENVQNNIPNITQSTSTIRLPQIKIPTFSGSYDNWPTFHDLFQKIVHLNPSLTNAEKMQYLKTHVDREAGRVIQHLQISDVNYSTAWDLLQTRYQNNRLILSKLIDKILDIPAFQFESMERIKSLHDTTCECLQAIQNLDISTTTWGPLINRILARKWDPETNRLYEQSLTNPNDIQEFKELIKFLKNRFQSLEAMGESKNRNTTRIPNQTRQPTEKLAACKYCQEEHYIQYCAKFKSLSVDERVRFVKSKKLCYNCLNHDSATKCWSTHTCSTCNKPHHSLLHYRDQKKAFTPSTSSSAYTYSTKRETRSQPAKLSNHVGTQEGTVLLATALVKTKTATGENEYLRVLVDSGSQACFITEHAAQVLGLPKQRIRAEVNGLGGDDPKISKAKIDVQIQPRFPSNFTLTTTFLILSKVTQSLPNDKLHINVPKSFENKLLADPTFSTPGPIDAIIGADEYGKIILDGLEKSEDGLLGQNTELGWILSGSVKRQQHADIQVTSLVSRVEEDQQLTRFWEMEEVALQKAFSQEEIKCEEEFERTVKRDEDGRYTVNIPFKAVPDLGNSRNRATARLIQLEKRLSKDEELRQQYNNFMAEYLHLGHMEQVTSGQGEGKYYIPHQAVIRPSSSTTKLRVVFDASCKTSNGKSLNESMHTGPRLQQDLADILLRWRKHRIVFTADIEKMYRQIQTDPCDQDFQRILWRFDKTQPIEEFRLKTVTYGTACAPYLAIKTLQKLANDEKSNFPIASEVALKDFYVDDILSGADTEEEAACLQQELINMLQAGGFSLRKWSSNSYKLIDSLPDELKDQTSLEITEDGLKKSLGVYWAPHADQFRFKVDVSSNRPVTKRTILSEVAKLFDPLGWLAPVVINAKSLIQELWLQNLEWDQPPPDNIQKKWREFQSKLKYLEEISLPRWVHTTNTTKIELHGFCDASEKAYGAVIYVRTTDNQGQIESTILTAKSKVAPARTKATLPRLELCAAVLLAKLTKRTAKALEWENVPIYAWTDSMIALSWIKGEVSRWKTFVANRVAEINNLLPSEFWYHVDTKENPADIISRGIDPAKIGNHKIWWKGPSWLVHSSIWPKQEELPDTKEERRTCYQATVTTHQNKLIEDFSSLTRLVRVMTYSRRFMAGIRRYKHEIGFLTVAEMRSTLELLITIVQQEAFKEEFQLLKKNSHLNKNNKLVLLNPFIDEKGTMRVGGRLKNANLPYNAKHPIILPPDNHLTKLIIQDSHCKTLHGGNQATLAHIRINFWIVHGKRSVQTWIRKCTKCIRFKAETKQQLMGDLPKERVTASPPFTHTGVDYAGPIQLRTTKGRGHKSYKGYIAVFVCLATKAVHLEAVTDMTTDAFLAAFRRFTSRRGQCSHMFSDNGTTFVGASKILEKEVFLLTKSSAVQDNIATQGTQWHFIPPAAPHFGGLWEAGVKSMKYHFKRIIGDTTLTYEEVTTLLHQIEACLNSRPLCVLSNDGCDSIILTPGHFLIGRSLLSSSDPISTDINTNLSSRWRVLQKMKKDFWQKWSTEYLSNLQQRYKWKIPHNNLEPGNIVLIKENNIIPTKWPMAKVVETHPASDGIVRVVSLKKSGGSITKRAIHNLIPLLPSTDKPDEKSIKINSNLGTIGKQINNSSTDRPTRICKQNSISKMWYIIMALIMITPKCIKANYSVKYPTPGLYVEHIGQARIQRGIFKLDIEFSQQKILTDMEVTSTTINQFEKLCKEAKKLSASTQCTSFLHHLKEQEKEARWIMDGIKAVIKRRQRRGLLGKLLTSIFGVNDEVYTDIEALERNQKELITASNHQTKFMISALSTFNKTETRINNHLESFRKKLNQGLQAINNMQRWFATIDTNTLNINVINAYHIATNVLTEVCHHYTHLLNVNLGNGNVYDLISPSHIHSMIHDANKKLPSNIYILTSLLRTKVIHIDDAIRIYAYFPMAEVAEFEVIKVNTIPLKITADSYWVFDITNDMIAIDYNNQLYFQMTDEEYRKSMALEETTCLCSPTTVKNIESNSNCVINELYNRHEENSCDIMEVKLKSAVWKQLYMVNTWLFISVTPQHIAVTCNGIREDVKLKKTGIIQVSQDCIIKTRQNILTPKKEDSLTILGSYNKAIQLPENFTSLQVQKHQPMLNEEPVLSVSDDLADLTAREDTIDQELYDTVWYKVKHHGILTSTITTTILMVIGITIWLVIRLLAKRRPHPKLLATHDAAMPLKPIPLQRKSLHGDLEPTSSTLQQSHHSRTEEDVIFLQPLYTDVQTSINDQ